MPPPRLTGAQHAISAQSYGKMKRKNIFENHFGKYEGHDCILFLHVHFFFQITYFLDICIL